MPNTLYESELVRTFSRAQSDVYTPFQNQNTRVSSCALATRMWRRRDRTRYLTDYTDHANSNANSNACRDLDHALGNEPELRFFG